MIQWNSIVSSVFEEVKLTVSTGQVADYIPQLSGIDPEKYGLCLTPVSGDQICAGDADEKFSVQSISKIYAVALAIALKGEDIWKRVGVEPSGNPFNSLVQLEYEKGIPRNPLINAGALVISDILLTYLKDPKQVFLNFVTALCGGDKIQINPAVAESEKLSGFKNASMAFFLKSFNNLDNEVQDVLDFYFFQCAIEMSCRELSQSFQLFAKGGIAPDGKRILTVSQTKRLNALMQTCGFYDESGDFAYRVGLPGKSGVGGGIVAVHPGQYSIAVWSPPLNKKGNSVKGMQTLELLTTRSGMSIF